MCIRDRVLYGDVPLISAGTLRQLIHETGAGSAVLTADLDDPSGYGRVLRDSAGRFERIVEDKDATPSELEIREINTGVLIVSAAHLNAYLPTVTSDNGQGEYYLPDILSRLVEDNEQILTINALSDEVLGINDRFQLARAEAEQAARAAPAHDQPRAQA